MLMHIGNAYRNPSKLLKIHLLKNDDHSRLDCSKTQALSKLAEKLHPPPQKGSASQPQKLDSGHVIDCHGRCEVIRALVFAEASILAAYLSPTFAWPT